MARRHKLWAKATRARMTIILGSRCAACGGTELLEFDCRTPQGDGHHRGNAVERICFYRRQMRAGNVQLLCQACNALKGDTPAATWETAVRMAYHDAAHQPHARPPGGGPSIPPAALHAAIRDRLLNGPEPF